MRWLERRSDAWSKDALLRLVSKEIANLRSFGARGGAALPRRLGVELRAPAGALPLVRQFLEDPSFDRELDADLLNRIPDLPASELPLRRYRLVAADEVAVGLTPDDRGIEYTLTIEG